MKDSTLVTERVHLGHFRRILRGSLGVAQVTTQELQNYVLRRQCEKGVYGRPVSATTISKELQTFRQMWRDLPNVLGGPGRPFRGPEVAAPGGLSVGLEKLRFRGRGRPFGSAAVVALGGLPVE